MKEPKDYDPKAVQTAFERGLDKSVERLGLISKPVQPPTTEAQKKVWGRMKDPTVSYRPNLLMRLGSKWFEKLTGK